MPNENNNVQTLLSVESLINSSSSRFDTLQKELKEHKEMVNSLLENDEEYQTIAKEHKKMTQQKNVAKQKVLTKPEGVEALDKIKEVQYQLKELKNALSDYLAQYVTLSGQNQIEGPDGVLRQIIYSAKLVVKK